jgi:hypothetical protein
MEITKAMDNNSTSTQLLPRKTPQHTAGVKASNPIYKVSYFL